MTLLCDPSLKDELVLRNSADQVEYIDDLISKGVTKLTESHVLALQSVAVRDIYGCGGTYRNALRDVEIRNSQHKVPPWSVVPDLVRRAIDRINDPTSEASTLERAAYALWRFNWIHPFSGGNGRTSRSIAYMVLGFGSGKMLPGIPTLPRRIYKERSEYVRLLAITDATIDDESLDDAAVDLAEITAFLRKMLMQQFASAIDLACAPTSKRTTQDQ